MTVDIVRAAALTVVVAVLAFILSWKNPLITRAVYRYAFFLGLAAFGAYFLFAPRGMSSTYIALSLSPWAILQAGLIVLLPFLPLVVLIETGIAGYRGFSSFVRYLALVLAILGIAGVIASLIVPRLHRG